jgi:hypothetical protein
LNSRHTEQQQSLITGYVTGGAYLAFWSSASPWIITGLELLALMICMTGGIIDGK